MGRDGKKLVDEHGYSPIFDCAPSRCAHSTTPQAIPAADRPEPRMIARTTGTRRRPGSPYATGSRIRARSRTRLFCLLLVGLVAITAAPAITRADDPDQPDLDRSIGAWLTLRGWLDEGNTPSETDAAASLEVPDLSEASVLLLSLIHI